MPKLQAQAAYTFYKTFILDYSSEKTAVYEQYGFSLQGSIGSKDWEVFAAILVNDRARAGDGADLVNYEVKSAVLGSSFEYQYHRHHGLSKLMDDQQVDHIFVARSETYTEVEAWLVKRAQLIPTFNKWLPELEKNYEIDTRQRFRRSVTYGFVRSHGVRLLEIRHGELASVLEET
jgi:hypothetical protein